MVDVFPVIVKIEVVPVFGLAVGTVDVVCDIVRFADCSAVAYFHVDFVVVVPCVVAGFLQGAVDLSANSIRLASQLECRVRLGLFLEYDPVIFCMFLYFRRIHVHHFVQVEVGRPSFENLEKLCHEV